MISKLSSVAKLVFVASFVLIATLLPFSQLQIRHNTRFGWKMYAMRAEDVEFRVHFRNGETQGLSEIKKRVPIGKIIKTEVDVTRFMPPHLCRQLPGAMAVTFSRSQSTTWESYQCK